MNNSIGKVSLTQSRFIWVIKDFERKTSTCKNIKSPVFVINFYGCNSKWTVNMTFDQRGKEGNEYIGIYLESQNNWVFASDLEFSILDRFDREVYKNKTDMNNGFSKFIKKDDLRNLLVYNQLTIICTITVNKYIEVEEHKRRHESLQLLRLEESDELFKLFFKQTYSDVTFQVEGKEISAHKCIIANRSPVFEAMFKHNTKERKNNTIIITDIVYTAMYDLLHFIYSGKVAIHLAERFQNYKNLILASDKYGIDNLKMECERRLINVLDYGNVFESLNLADQLNATTLKENAIEYIAEYGDFIIDLPIYKEFGKLHPDISCEVFRALLIKRKRYN